MATASVETTSTWGELIKHVGVQFAEVYNQSLESYSLAMDDMVAQQGNKLTSVAKNTPADGKVVHFIQKTGVGYPVVTDENSAFHKDSRILGYKTSVTIVKFTNAVDVTLEAMKDNAYKQQLDEFADLTIGMKEGMDKSFFDGVCNYAFTAQSSLPSYVTGYGDGKPLLSTSHPRKDGGTAQLNTFSSSETQLTLTDTNLETARVYLQRQLDDRGKPTNGGGGKLVLLVPPELEKTAVILTKGEKRSGTANNDVNIYDGIMTVISSKYIAYTGNPSSLASTAWFLLDPRAAQLRFNLREGIQTHSFTHPETLTTSFYVYARWAVSWVDWRGFFGSKGDVSAYSS